MKKKLFPILLMLTALLFSNLACRAAAPLDIQRVVGSGQVEIETRLVSDFHSLDLSGIGELSLVQGEQENLEIEAEDNLLPLITSQVRGGTLYIGIKEGVNLDPSQPIRYRLTMKEVRSIHSSGVSDIQAGELHSQELSLRLSGVGSLYIASLFGADIETQQLAERLTIDQSGVGDCQIDGGLVKHQALNLDGAGSYIAPDLQSQSAQVNISGVGGATLWVVDELSGNISGAGTLSYYGSPSVKIKSSGVGSATSLGDR